MNDSRSELEEERDFLLRSLDDLESEHAAGDLEDDDYRSLEADYTARAAGVLRRLQHLDGPSDQPPKRQGQDGDLADRSHAKRSNTLRRSLGAGHSGRERVRRRWPMLLGILSTIVLATGSGYLVATSSGERRPDQGVSGGPESSPRSLLQQAIDLDNGGKLVDAAKMYDAVLAEEPDNVVALTRRGWILGQAGRQAGNVELLQAALNYLNRATMLNPGYADPHAFKGLILGALARAGEAACEFRMWLATAPTDDARRPDIERVLDQAVKQAGGSLPDCPRAPGPVPAPADTPPQSMGSERVP